MSEPKASPSTRPLSEQRLKQIANDACTLALESASHYDHTRTESWNGGIINHILRALISESAGAGGNAGPPWKFSVNSTIIQHLSPGGEGGGGRRGMHSACGAYWNNEKDGMWSYKYETKGMDVVVSVMWIAI